MFNPRPQQSEILKYESGWMGVPAVPGSGKTHTLSYLASLLITKGLVSDEQEILIVTLVNSAVDNFAARISTFIKEAGLLPNIGYRVRTLHGLAHDIIRERPDLCGLSEQFSIIDDEESKLMVKQITEAYIREHSELALEFLEPSIEIDKDPFQKKQWYAALTDLSANFINQAKNMQLDPCEISSLAEEKNIRSQLLVMGIEIYGQYQRGLRFRNALDFSDLTRYALESLQNDDGFRKRLQNRWPYILEDEAQDSSEIQEKILRSLVGVTGNWVRVGDTNQAIYETFTTASPKYLRDFLQESNVTTKNLANSGRSNLSIIKLANNLITWTKDSHPVDELRKTLTPPLIEPVPPGDPQSNPPDNTRSIYIHKPPLTPDKEIAMVVNSIKNWLPENKEKTVAVLCPIGFHAEKVVAALNTENIEVVELLQTTQSTRRVTKQLENSLIALADPSSVKKFVNLFHLFLQSIDSSSDYLEGIEKLTTRLRKVRFLEGFLYPVELPRDSEVVDYLNIPVYLKDKLSDFCNFVRRWNAATVLPVDQLLIIIGRDLFSTPEDLALTHKLSLMLASVAQNHPEYRLEHFKEELAQIGRNERKFIGFSSDDTSFKPEAHKGKVLVSTFHKAKGLEWDRVYLISVNNYDFPSVQEFDQYKGEKRIFRDRLNLEAELSATLKALIDGKKHQQLDAQGKATQAARSEYSAERLRLLYVGITRARESLMITWNTGRFENCKIALPLEALHSYWESTHADS
jgi:DNA helicase-2/ATP-dependent DNA helicase PcrA